MRRMSSGPGIVRASDAAVMVERWVRETTEDSPSELVLTRTRYRG